MKWQAAAGERHDGRRRRKRRREEMGGRKEVDEPGMTVSLGFRLFGSFIHSRDFSSVDSVVPHGLGLVFLFFVSPTASVILRYKWKSGRTLLILV